MTFATTKDDKQMLTVLITLSQEEGFMKQQPDNYFKLTGHRLQLHYCQITC